jgi:hypothetical protein
MKNYQQSSLRNNGAIWLTVAAVMAGYGSSALAQTISESATAPVAGVWLSQLIGGSTSSSPGASAQDYLNAVNPSQTFTVGSAQTLGQVTVQGNNDAGYYTPNGAPDVASAIFNGYSGGLNSQPGLVPLLTWDLQIGSVSGSTITPIASESVTGFAPTSSSDFLTFNLASALSLGPGTYAFSLTFDTSTLNDFGGPTAGSVWYGLQESLVPVAGGAAFDNGTAGGQGVFANNAVSPFGYSYVFELSSVPEPTTLALLGFGTLGAVLGLRRRRA